MLNRHIRRIAEPLDLTGHGHKATFNEGSGKRLLSGCFGKTIEHTFLEGEKLLHAWPGTHAIEMCRAVFKRRKVDFKLLSAPHAPKKMGIRGGEVIKKEFAVSEQIVGDLEIFVQRHFRKSAHAFRRIRRITDISRRKDPEEKRVESRSAPRHERQRLQLLPGIT